MNYVSHKYVSPLATLSSASNDRAKRSLHDMFLCRRSGIVLRPKFHLCTGRHAPNPLVVRKTGA